MLPSRRKLGALTVLLFSIKGVLWLVIPVLVYSWGC